MRRPMIKHTLVLLTLACPSAALSASDLAVLPQGRYGCWTAGSATGPARIDDPAYRFTIVRGSSYASAGGGGTYLLAGDLLVFTRGPLKDLRLRRNRDGYWQRIARDGKPGALKCSRLGTAPTA